MATKYITDAIVIFAYIEARKLGVHPEEVLMKHCREPEKVCYAAMERACERDYIEYAVSLRTGWPTDKGLKLLLKTYL